MSATYPITTLRDIWNLPTHEQMETCLKELSKSMLEVRAVNDLAKSTTKLSFQWPEVVPWIDDGKGLVGADFLASDGKTNLLSMRIVRETKGKK